MSGPGANEGKGNQCNVIKFEEAGVICRDRIVGTVFYKGLQMYIFMLFAYLIQRETLKGYAFYILSGPNCRIVYVHDQSYDLCYQQFCLDPVTFAAKEKGYSMSDLLKLQSWRIKQPSSIQHLTFVALQVQSVIKMFYCFV